MKSTAALALLIGLAAASDMRGRSIEQRKTVLPVVREELINPKILNGQVARPNQFPYQAGLSLLKGRVIIFCGGSIISHEWVITAAHCTNGAQNAVVYLGGITRLNSSLVFTVNKKDITMHPCYDAATANNDIALINIPAIKFSPAIQPIALPKIGENIYISVIVTTSGWGYTSDQAKSSSPTLLYTDLKIIANSECGKYYQTPKIDNAKLCAAHYRGGATCLGDSGGPLVSQFPKVLVGVTSFGPDKGCSSNIPDGFTRVTYYLNWIKKITGHII